MCLSLVPGFRLISEKLCRAYRFTDPTESSRHPYSTYAVFITTLHPPAPVMEGLIPLCLHQALRQGQLSDYGITYWQAMRAFVAFWFTSKWIRNLGHYIRYPVDICLIPVSIIFGWLHGIIIKLWALGTLDQVCADAESEGIH